MSSAAIDRTILPDQTGAPPQKGPSIFRSIEDEAAAGAGAGAGAAAGAGAGAEAEAEAGAGAGAGADVGAQGG